MRITDTPLYRAAARALGDMDLIDAEVDDARAATWQHPAGPDRREAAREYFALRREQEAKRNRYREAHNHLAIACAILGVTPPLPTP
ncbi:hypothetical protein NE857_09310 [Nocardiopsis exhalans]|uniref:Uncharacterized protein n=1 Tax=Nocardiopsis exhalans TaxID=163604 RepID=A0ABY5DBR0_9ACTN|nr:hypothetical protein [Nocardiopsis exhalans]USY21779.1 hypothetical protein NE857_09310 [Nocardiopsis exhalans]